MLSSIRCLPIELKQMLEAFANQVEQHKLKLNEINSTKNAATTIDNNALKERAESQSKQLNDLIVLSEDNDLLLDCYLVWSEMNDMARLFEYVYHLITQKDDGKYSKEIYTLSSKKDKGLNSEKDGITKRFSNAGGEGEQSNAKIYAYGSATNSLSLQLLRSGDKISRTVSQFENQIRPLMNTLQIANSPSISNQTTTPSKMKLLQDMDQLILSIDEKIAQQNKLLIELTAECTQLSLQATQQRPILRTTSPASSSNHQQHHQHWSRIRDQLLRQLHSSTAAAAVSTSEGLFMTESSSSDHPEGSSKVHFSPETTKIPEVLLPEPSLHDPFVPSSVDPRRDRRHNWLTSHAINYNSYSNYQNIYGWAHKMRSRSRDRDGHSRDQSIHPSDVVPPPPPKSDTSEEQETESGPSLLPPHTIQGVQTLFHHNTSHVTYYHVHDVKKAHAPKTSSCDPPEPMDRSLDTRFLKYFRHIGQYVQRTPPHRTTDPPSPSNTIRQDPSTSNQSDQSQLVEVLRNIEEYSVVKSPRRTSSSLPPSKPLMVGPSSPSTSLLTRLSHQKPSQNSSTMMLNNNSSSGFNGMMRPPFPSTSNLSNIKPVQTASQDIIPKQPSVSFEPSPVSAASSSVSPRYEGRALLLTPSSPNLSQLDRRLIPSSPNLSQLDDLEQKQNIELLNELGLKSTSFDVVNTKIPFNRASFARPSSLSIGIESEGTDPFIALPSDSTSPTLSSSETKPSETKPSSYLSKTMSENVIIPKFRPHNSDEIKSLIASKQLTEPILPSTSSNTSPTSLVTSSMDSKSKVGVKKPTNAMLNAMFSQVPNPLGTPEKATSPDGSTAAAAPAAAAKESNALAGFSLFNFVNQPTPPTPTPSTGPPSSIIKQDGVSVPESRSEGTGSEDSVHQAEIVHAIYRQCNPAKLNEIPQLLLKYKGQEAQLVANLVKKYGEIAAKVVASESASSQPKPAMGDSLTGSSSSVHKPPQSTLFASPNTQTNPPLSNPSTGPNPSTGGFSLGSSSLFKSNPMAPSSSQPSMFSSSLGSTSSFASNNPTFGNSSSFMTASPSPQTAGGGAGHDASIVYAIYQKCNPAKLSEIPHLLEKYQHQESQLVANLVKKYGAVAAEVAMQMSNNSAPTATSNGSSFGRQGAFSGGFQSSLEPVEKAFGRPAATTGSFLGGSATTTSLFGGNRNVSMGTMGFATTTIGGLNSQPNASTTSHDNGGSGAMSLFRGNNSNPQFGMFGNNNTSSTATATTTPSLSFGNNAFFR